MASRIPSSIYGVIIRMNKRFVVGDSAFIVESNRFIKEVKVLSTAGGLYLIQFLDTGGGIKVKEHRLFATKEEAERSIRKSQ